MLLVIIRRHDQPPILMILFIGIRFLLVVVVLQNLDTAQKTKESAKLEPSLYRLNTSSNGGW